MLYPNGSYKYINQTGLDYLGITQEEMASKDWQPFMHPNDLEKVSQRVREAVQASRPYRNEHRLRTKSGAYSWVFFTGVACLCSRWNH